MGFRTPPKPTLQHDYYLVIDLEATCCDVNNLPKPQITIPKYETETIEIGAVMADARTFEPVAQFSTFVRPVRHPELTEFCTELTTIQQADLVDAPLFPQALAALTDWAGQFSGYLFCSWGNYDRRQFEQDCHYHRIAYPFRGGHVNLKFQFTEQHQLAEHCHMEAALERTQLPLVGTHHRGIDDARNMVRMLPWVFGNEPLPRSP